MLTIALVVMVIFLFLRNLAGDGHPQRRRAAVARRHVRRDVPARLQPQQPDADGAHDLDRLRRRRRDRDDREHRRATSRRASRRCEAALKGAEQIGFTIVSLTVSLIAVLIPLLFMGDIVGRLFREFAVTLSVTILVSAVVSLTLTPMMCAQLLRHTPESEQGRFYRASERVFERDHRRSTAGRCGGCCGTRPPTLLVARRRRSSLTVLLYVVDAQGLLPGAGHRRDPRHLRGAADGLVRGDGRAAAGARRR